MYEPTDDFCVTDYGRERRAHEEDDYRREHPVTRKTKKETKDATKPDICITCHEPVYWKLEMGTWGAWVPLDPDGKPHKCEVV